MSIPDSAREEAGKVEIEEGGLWKIDGVPMTIGMPLYAYDERPELYEFARVTETSDRSMLVTFSDGFRFLFGTKNPAIKLHPQVKKAVEEQGSGAQHPLPGSNYQPQQFPPVAEEEDFYYWKGKYEGAIEMARLLSSRGDREERDRD